MADKEHLDLITKGFYFWNTWRNKNPGITPDLSDADLQRVNLEKFDLRNANLKNANLSHANLSEAVLSKADLSKAILYKANLEYAHFHSVNLEKAILVDAYIRGADFTNANLLDAVMSESNLSEALFVWAHLWGADLSNVKKGMADFRYANFHGADLTGADLSGANLNFADLYKANLSKVNLQEASLIGARLVETNLENTNLSGCKIYGISAWDLKMNEETDQSNLVITYQSDPIITVDNLEVAQFIYLLIKNEKIRNAIDSIISKVVLILGRFTPKRKEVLNCIREELRKHDLLPVLFDFEKPVSRDFVETISILAHLSCFVIADFTDAKIVLEEVPQIVRNVAVPVIPLLSKDSGKEPVTLNNLRKNHKSLLATIRYINSTDLIKDFSEKIIQPAKAKTKELNGVTEVKENKK